MNYPKGSEWRKWDLQVQTIVDDGYASLRNYYEGIRKAQPQKWQEFVGKVGGEANALLFDSKEHFGDGAIDKKARCTNYARNLFSFVESFNPELACIAFTDHNYFDEILLDVLIDYSKKSRCKAIPGVEINCNGVHMLLLFRDKLYGKDSHSAGIQTLLARFKIDARKKEGVLTVTTCDIKEIIFEVQRNDGLVVYPHCNSANGLFQQDRTILAETYNYQKLNLLQLQNREGFSALEEYITIKNKARVSKFCLHTSSDARALRDIGRADKDGNFLWIKANPTFDGLKQIIFEPEQRILVGPQRPEQKKPYFIIDKVRFLDNTADVNFGSDPIEINQNLTTIVGGKSTGKSLLLYYMAKTINKAEVDNRIQPTELKIDYGFDEYPDFNFEVIWKDGQSSFLKPTPASGPGETTERKILYIPQKYLNTLSEKNIESREALNEFILGVILQDVVLRDKYDDAFDALGQIVKALPTKIAELYAEGEDIKRTEEELKESGDEKGIATYIESLKIEIDKIKSESGLSEAELAEYESITGREKDINTRISNLDSDRKTIKTLQVQLSTKLADICGLTVEHQRYINDDEIKLRMIEQFKVIETFEPAVSGAVSNVLALLEQTAERLKGEQVEIKSKLTPYLAKVRAQSSLQEKTKALQNEQKKLADIAVKKNAVKTKENSYNKKIEGLVESYTQMVAKYETLRNEFKTFESKFGDIALAVHVAFKDEEFNVSVVEEFLAKRDVKKTVANGDWTEDSKYRYDPQHHLSNMSGLLKGLISGSVKTVKSRSPKDAVAKLLEDYFFLDFKIFYKNDALEKMSPGKKGLVLLRLLISLSDEEWPILLDQPEDDLDNRSVYEELVRFIKDRKNRRQLIIVTHNPNLVVGADAEEVIVANQSGQEVGRENKKFRFEYVSDAIEDAFESDEKKEPAVLFRKGIRQHVCEILEGGPEAFQKREQKYNFQ